MPITAEYTWEESDEVIAILIPLRGAKACAEHVFITNEYVKVNSAPYFLELDLLGEIRAADSRAIFSRDGLRLHLHKSASAHWGELVSELPKAERLARREASIENRYAELREQKNTKKKEKTQDDKKALHSHFDMEDSRKQWIEGKKKAEVELQADELAEWQRKEEAAAAMLQAGDDAEDSATNSAIVRSGSATVAMRRKKKASKVIFDRPDLPAPRAANTVKISFTQTTRPTPARADNTDKIGPNDAPRSKPVLKRVRNPDAVDIGEQNPVWLKDRGDQYFAVGDFSSAANAYSAAIALDDDEYVATIAARVATYYSNRAACYLQLGKHRKCASDCDRALELMELANSDADKQATEKMLRMMCKLHTRQAAALTHLGEVDEARRHYHDAIKHSPEDMIEGLQADLTRLGAIEIKQDADAAVKLGDFPKALQLYAHARKVDPENATLWSNAALCHLALKDNERCIEACTNALDLLNTSAKDKASRQTTAKVVLRRAAARLELKQVSSALEDYEFAAQLLPDDERIASDLGKVRARLKRREADQHYKAGEIELASEVYQQVLEHDETDTKARGNRIACLLRLCRYVECVEEATLLLEGLEAGADKARAQALVRRGAAHAKLGNYQQGIKDYEQSLEIVEDPQVRADMETMLTLQSS